MAVEEQPPVANAAGASGTTAMDVDTGNQSKYVLTFHNLHTPILATGASCYHSHCAVSGHPVQLAHTMYPAAKKQCKIVW